MISWDLKTRGYRPIGLDIGHDSIKMIQLAIKKDCISVVAADKVRIEPNINDDSEQRRNFVTSAVRQMLADGNFQGRNVVSCLPNDSLEVTSLRLSETETKEIDQVLQKEVVQRFGLDPSKDEVEYMFAGNVRQGDEIKNELIVFAADNETIKSHIEILEDAELRPIAIDPVACALFRNFERLLRRQDDKERAAVFVDIGSKATTVVFGRGQEISFVKQIPIGGEKFNRQIATKLCIGVDEAQRLRETFRMERTSGRDNDLKGRSTLDASTRQVITDAVGVVAEELAREISLCLRYYTVTFRGKRVESAFFSGGEAYENILINVLKRHLTVDIEVAQPLRGIDITNINFDSDRRGLLCEWAVAVGLGLKGWKALAAKDTDYERN